MIGVFPPVQKGILTWGHFLRLSNVSVCRLQHFNMHLKYLVMTKYFRHL